jgi:hypothetical protein
VNYGDKVGKIDTILALTFPIIGCNKVFRNPTNALGSLIVGQSWVTFMDLLAEASIL